MTGELTIKLCSIPHFAVAIILIALGVLTYWKNRSASINRWFAALCIAISCWYAGFGVALNVKGVANHILWQKIAHIGCLFVPPIYVYLTLKLLRLERLRFIAYAHFMLAAVIYGLMWVTDWYFPGTVYQYAWGVYPRPGVLLTLSVVLTALALLGLLRALLARLSPREAGGAV